jgi:hypothetical protein
MSALPRVGLPQGLTVLILCLCGLTYAWPFSSRASPHARPGLIVRVGLRELGRVSCELRVLCVSLEPERDMCVSREQRGSGVGLPNAAAEDDGCASGGCEGAAEAGRDRTPAPEKRLAAASAASIPPCLCCRYWFGFGLGLQVRVEVRMRR